MLNKVPQPLAVPPLSDEQKGRVLGVLSVGCDRETASNIVGCSVVGLVRAMRSDAEFGAAVRRTEAAVEVKHMRVVHQVVDDVKNWRASVWWLERRSPERFGKRSAGTVTSRHLKSFLAIIGNLLNDNVHDGEDRERVVARLNEYKQLIDEMVDDSWESAASLERDSTGVIVDDEDLTDAY